MIILSANDITVEYGTDVVLDKINFSVNEGDRLGVIGVNGCGKSTLLGIISGRRSASRGEVFISKGRTVGFLEQNAMLESDKTVYEEMLGAFEEAVKTEERLEELSAYIEQNTDKHDTDLYNSIISEFSRLSEHFSKIGGYEYKSRIRSMLMRFGFDETMHQSRISTLSGGERTRLALVRLLLLCPDILMLDEPTNHLDTVTLEWLEEHLKQYPKTLIIVSHDRYFLDKVTNKILDIEHTTAKLYNGNYTAFAVQKAEAQKTLARKYEQQQKEIARIEGIIAMQKRFGQERNYVTIASKQKQIEHMEKVDAPKAAPKSIRMSFSSAGETGNDVIYAEDLEKSFGGRRIFENVSFLVRRHDRIIIVGPNGCGKSTLIKIIGGHIPADGGICEFGANVVVGYYDQEQQSLNTSNTVLEELRDAHSDLTFTQIRTALASFLFFAEDIEKNVGSLSGGEKARLMLCKMILSKVNVLILDEPTNHLDISSREALENALLEFEGTIIAVSHDRYFIKKLGNRIFDMGGGFRDFKGSYEEFLSDIEARKEESAAEESRKKSSSEQKQKYMENKKALSDLRKLKSRMERDEAQIEKLEAELAALDAEANGEASANYVRLSEISKKSEEISKRLDELYADYDEAEQLLSSMNVQE